MARRTAEEVEALRSHIVEAAVKRFADHGVEATSIADIAADVGISKQALMHHYRTKAALREAIAARIKASFDDALPWLVQAYTAEGEAVGRLAGDTVSMLDRDVDLSRYILRELLFSPELDVPRSGHAANTLILDYLRRGQREGRLRTDFVPEDAILCLGLMFLAVRAVHHMRSDAEGDVSDEDLLVRRQRELVRITRSALLPPARSSEG